MRQALKRVRDFILRRETAWGVALVLFVAASGMLSWILSSGSGKSEKSKALVSRAQDQSGRNPTGKSGNGRRESRIDVRSPGSIGPSGSTKVEGKDAEASDAEITSLFANVITDLEKSIKEALGAKNPTEVRRLMKMLAGLVRDPKYGSLARIAFRDLHNRVKLIDWKSSGVGGFGGGDAGVVDFIDSLAAEVGVEHPKDLSVQLMMELDGWASDAERGEVVRKYSTQINDENIADQLVWEVDSNKMRNSEAIKTLTHMLENGTDVVREKAIAAAEKFTGLEEITSTDQLQEWLKENPDSEGDAERYAGKKPFMETTSFDDH